MSTAGSVRSGDAPVYGPPAAGGGTPNDQAMKPRLAIFRWKGIIPLILGLALVATVWLLFADRLLRSSAEEAGTRALGTELDVATLHFDLVHTSIQLNGVAIADPFDARRNLLEVK